MKRCGLRKRKAQMDISFGMIFSILLIIIFISFAFFAIKKVLSTNDLIKIRDSIDDLQVDVDEVYGSSGGGYEVSGVYSFPQKIERVCFIDYSCENDLNTCIKGRNGNEARIIFNEMQLYSSNGGNLFLYPSASSEGVNSVKIKNIYIGEITRNENPYCINNGDGEIEIYLKKFEGKPLVVVERK